MPIVEEPDPGSPLTQGDILRGVKSFMTTRVSESGGDSTKIPLDTCMVLSRPCVAEHKKQITVAAIATYTPSVPKEVTGFEKVKKFLTKMRDGPDTPDLFYLGHFPGASGRFCARLDSIHTIEIPDEPVARTEFLRRHRVGRLQDEFARDLHLRLFGAFASLGFSDDSWFSTSDLGWLVSEGKKELAAAEQVFQEQKAQKSRLEAEGKQFAEKELLAAQGRLQQLQAQLAPYEAELTRRERSLAAARPASTAPPEQTGS